MKKSGKNSGYENVVKTEYKIVSQALPFKQLKDLQDLLDKIAEMQSPQKEMAFVEGVLLLNKMTPLAA